MSSHPTRATSAATSNTLFPPGLTWLIAKTPRNGATNGSVTLYTKSTMEFC